VSLSNFNGDRAVNSPRSLEACRRLGVLPDELLPMCVRVFVKGYVYSSLGRFVSTPPVTWLSVCPRNLDGAPFLSPCRPMERFRNKGEAAAAAQIRHEFFEKKRLGQPASPPLSRVNHGG
jgi:hypothetical protein